MHTYMVDFEISVPVLAASIEEAEELAYRRVVDAFRTGPSTDDEILIELLDQTDIIDYGDE